jgi:hypothetical protein
MQKRNAELRFVELLGQVECERANRLVSSVTTPYGVRVVDTLITLLSRCGAGLRPG